MFRLGADPHQLVQFDDLGKAGVFGKKAIAGVDGVGVGDLRRSDDVGDVQIAIGDRWRADAHRLVGQPHMRSEEHTSELQSLMRISYAVFCLKKKKQKKTNNKYTIINR